MSCIFTISAKQDILAIKQLCRLSTKNLIYSLFLLSCQKSTLGNVPLHLLWLCYRLILQFFQNRTFVYGVTVHIDILIWLKVVYWFRKLEIPSNYLLFSQIIVSNTVSFWYVKKLKWPYLMPFTILKELPLMFFER